VFLELRHLVHYAFDRAKVGLSPLEQAALTLQSLPAFQAVDVRRYSHVPFARFRA
jgi:hypothetical protein